LDALTVLKLSVLYIQPKGLRNSSLVQLGFHPPLPHADADLLATSAIPV
jgi:hypothetical protein